MNLMISRERTGEHGGVVAIVVAVTLGVFAAGFAGLAIWAYMSYSEAKDDVDGQIALAVAEAKKEQADQDEEKFAEREKEPRREFVGPVDYGRATFDYPKTWSVYIASNTAGRDFEAYLNPITVPPVKSDQRFALRVSITDDPYDKTVASYQSRVKTGDLRSSLTSSNGQTGTRFDGSFSKNIRGALVVYKIRDKSLIIQTDADTFKPEFEKIIKTIKFNT